MIDPTDYVTYPMPLTETVVLYFQSPSRVYRAELLQDLLSDWIVILSWGGRGNNRGGRRISVVPDPDTGLRMLQEVIKVREKRGYKLLTQHYLLSSK